ncbi:MAG: hypothetical protein ACMUEL_02830 [Flavobacteriales bacterium Tduv]
MPNDGSGGFTDFDCCSDFRGLIGLDDDICLFYGYVTSETSHCNSDIACVERRSIVDSVPTKAKTLEGSFLSCFIC